jgi:cytochrome P450
MISAASDALIDKFIENGHCDLASDFASLLPSITIAELLGVPEHEQSQFRTWTTFLLDVRDRARTVAVAKEFRAYCFELVQRRRANPGDDLTTHLVQSKIDGRPLSDSELLGFLLAIITGGIETTASAIGNSLLFLGHNPEVRGRLAMDPSALRDAVEELLRYDSPVQVTRRTVMRDVEVAGKQMKLGDDVIVLWGAANRDSDEFENGDSFVEGRTSNRHLAFGSGAHRCLGSHLARIEISIAIQRVLDRLGDYQIEDQDVERTMGISRGTGKLPVRFTPGSRLGADH